MDIHINLNEMMRIVTWKWEELYPKKLESFEKGETTSDWRERDYMDRTGRTEAMDTGFQQIAIEKLVRRSYILSPPCIQHLRRDNIMRVTGHIESEVITSLKYEDYTTTPAATKKGLL